MSSLKKNDGCIFATVGARNQLPVIHDRSEFPLVGRSNVGKSSLTNALCGAKVARTSRDPGRTRMVHFYQMAEDKNLLVDLPGFGFHKAAKTEAKKWAPLMQAYFQHQRPQAVLYLQDCRRDFSTDDFDFIESLRNAAEVWLVLTKTDKLNQKELHKRKVYFEGQPFASKFFVSSLKTGKYDWRKLQSKLNQTADQKAAEPFPQSTP